MSQVKSLREQVAIVTGAASGLGAALSRELVNQGARVIVADIAIDKAREFAISLGKCAEAVKLDVTNDTEIRCVFDQVLHNYGRIDLVINNAGLANFGEATSISLDDWRKLLDVNLWGVILGSLAALRTMKAQRSGKIVNIGSASVFSCDPLLAPYITSKYGVVGLTRVLAIEAEQYGIQVSLVCPGNIRTPLLDQREPSWITPAIPVEVAAKRILRDVLVGRRFIVFPLRWKLVWWIDRFSPNLLNPLRRVILRRASHKETT